jgi:hypothetical protein
MSVNPPPNPVPIPPIYNPSNYVFGSSGLTIAQADLRYLKLTGGILSGLCTFTAGLTSTGQIVITNSSASTSSSTGALQCAGGAYFGANSIFNAGIKIPTGASNGFVLTSDASGNASWQVISAAFSGFANGSAASPSGYFTNFPSTGLYYNSGVGISVSGSNVAQFSSSGLLLTGTGSPTILSNLKLNGYDTINSFIQYNLQNLSSGTAASADIVATNDKGNDSFGYVNMGINSSGNTGTLGGPSDSYIYCVADSAAAGGDLWLGTVSTSTLLYLFGATSSPTSANSISLSATALNLPSNIAMTVNNTTQSTSPTTGSVILSGGLGVSLDVHMNGNLHMYNSTGNIQFNSTNTLTLAPTALASPQTLNIPAITSTDTICTLALAQTITGQKTLINPILQATGNGKLQISGTGAAANTIAMGTTTGLTWTMPTNTATLATTNTAQTISGANTFSGGIIVTKAGNTTVASSPIYVNPAATANPTAATYNYTYFVQPPAFTGTAQTIPSSATIYIAGAPLPGTSTITNAYSLQINAGATSIPSGAVGTPSLVFATGANTTGIYSSAANNIDFAVSGANVANMNSTGLNVNKVLKVGGNGSNINQIQRGVVTVSNTFLASGGTINQAFSFSASFSSAPNVILTQNYSDGVNLQQIVLIAATITTTGFTVYAFNSGGSAATGNIIVAYYAMN